MNIIRTATMSEVYECLGFRSSTCLWIQCYSVAFKTKRGKRLKWYVSLDAKNPLEASVEAKNKFPSKYREYGISLGFRLFVPNKIPWSVNAAKPDML